MVTPRLRQPYMPAGPLVLLALACAVIAAHWWLIARYGSPVPFWDQWDGEAANLYAPYLHGGLTWQALIEPHNEHRILTTRLFALGLYILNTQWNPLLQMATNAALLAAALCSLASMVTRELMPGSRLALCAFIAVLTAIPYAWENTLSGFQTQFYWNLLFSFWALWLLVMNRPFSAWWWTGALVAGLAYFSLASGLFVFAASASVLLLRGLQMQRHAGAGAGARGWLAPRSAHWPYLTAAALLFGMFALGYVATPVTAGHAGMKAHSAGEFMNALKAALSWPQRERIVPALLLNLPCVAFMWMLWRRRSQPFRPAVWVLLGLIVWVGAQAVALSYGRAASVRSSRYLDLLAVGTILNFGCLLWCLQQSARLKARFGVLIVVVWLAYLAGGLWHQRHAIEGQVEHKLQMSQTEQANVHAYLASSDPAHLYDKPLLHIPYPDADRLRQLLDDPAVRRILPAAVVPPSLPEHHAGVFDAGLKRLEAYAYVVLVLGGLFMLCALAHWIKAKNRWRSAG